MNSVKGAGGGQKTGEGRNRVLYCFRQRGVSATRCFSLQLDQKILFLAVVIEFQNLENTGNYSTCKNFKRNFPKTDILEFQNLSPPTVFETNA